METTVTADAILGLHLETLLVLAVLLLVLFLIVAIIRRHHQRNQQHATARADRDDALRLLRCRLERGAISRSEYDRLRRSLES